MKQFELQFINDVDIQVEETDGINSPQSDINTSTYGSMKIGRLEVSEIYIPNKTDPLFSVDNEGNAKVNSLARNDFHWFSAFESIDGYGYSAGSTGSRTAMNPNGLVNTTGGTLEDYSDLFKQIESVTTGAFNWDKDRNFKVSFLISGTVNELESYISTGSMNVLTNPHIGWHIHDGYIYAHCGNGSAYTESSSLQLLTAATFYILEINFIAGTSAEFIINGVSKATITTNIPSQYGGSDYLFYHYLKTTDNNTKTTIIGYVDFWQAN